MLRTMPMPKLTALFMLVMGLILVATTSYLPAWADPLEQHQIEELSYWPNWVADNGGCSSATGGGNLSGNTPAQKAFNYFISKGLTPAQAAGVVGNLMVESGGNTENLDTHAHNNISGTHDGIAQWSGGRWAALKQHERGDPYDLANQLDYLMFELGGGGGEPNTLADIKKAKTPEEAALAFQNGFERCGSASACSQINRVTNAKKIFAKSGGTEPGTTITASAVTSAGSCGASSGGVDGLKNPFRDVKQLRPERIDMGVDYAGQGTVYALGNGIIHNLTNSGWNYGGYAAFISVELTDPGPLQGKYWYMAEACVPVSGLAKGQHVTADTPICKMINPGSTGIETGWAAPPGAGSTLASSNGGYVEGKATELGENMNDLLVKLGAPPGTQQARMGSLPAGWPTWK